MTTKNAALAKVTKLTAQAAAKKEAAATVQQNRDAALLAGAEAGATYRELAEASGLTEFRITQVLHAQRRLNA